MNKRGDFESLLFIIIALIGGAIAFFVLSHLNNSIYTGLQEEMNVTYSGTESVNALNKIKISNNSIWDYAFLILLIGYVIAMGLTAWSVRISPIFMWIYILMCGFLLVVAVVGANLWQDLSTDTEFAETLTHFPIMDYIMSKLPIFVTVIIGFTIVFLFGKPSETI